jgi:hypothetical protein
MLLLALLRKGMRLSAVLRPLRLDSLCACALQVQASAMRLAKGSGGLALAGLRSPL